MMFSNFEKAFKKNNFNNKIPKEVIDSLSEKLPSGFKYADIGDGACAITPIPEESIQLKVNIEVPKKFPNDFKPSTLSELLEFTYRSQKTLKVIPDEDGCILISGSKFNINELIKFPFCENDIRTKELCIQPKEFQPAFKATIEGDGVKKDIFIKRQPYEYMHKSLFKNINDEILEISYILDEENFRIDFRFNIDIEKSRNVNEILDALKLYKSFLDKKIKIGNENIFNFLDFKDMNLPDEEEPIDRTIEFWKRIADIENVLGVAFIPEFPIEFDKTILLDELYRSFIEKKPYKEYVKMNKLTTKFTSKLDKEKLIGTNQLSFNFIQNNQIEIWGVQLNLYDSIGVFDFTVKDIVLKNLENPEYDFLIEPINNNGIYISIIHFLNIEDAQNYNKNIDNLKDAEPI